MTSMLLYTLRLSINKEDERRLLLLIINIYFNFAISLLVKKVCKYSKLLDIPVI
jgi:hypothetical protein